MSTEGVTPETATPSAESKTRKKGMPNPFVFMILLIGTLVALPFGIVFLISSPLATNEQVRSAYNVDIIENPEFTGKDMLKVNDEKLAELCVRPSVKDVENKTPLSCKVLQ